MESCEVGGTDFKLEAIGDIDTFNPVTRSWTRLAPIPTQRSGAAAGVINEELYVAGGTYASGKLPHAFEVYSPVANT